MHFDDFDAIMGVLRSLSHVKDNEAHETFAPPRSEVGRGYRGSAQPQPTTTHAVVPKHFQKSIRSLEPVRLQLLIDAVAPASAVSPIFPPVCSGRVFLHSRRPAERILPANPCPSSCSSILLRSAPWTISRCCGRRGTGLSDRVSAIPTLEERMDDVRAVMDAVDSKQAALLGSSEGGPMSILFSAT